MIAPSGPEAAVLAAKAYRIYLRTEIKNAGGFWRDYSVDDFQYRAEVAIDVDARIAQATIELVRESSGNSLAPLVNADIAVGREVRLSAARVAAGAVPAGGDWKPLFAGSIDEWGHPSVEGETEDNRLNLVARDGLAVLQDRFVEEASVYGADAGVPLESVMQAILTDWCDDVQLYVPVPTGTLSGQYRQDARVTVLDAIQALADLIGWVIEWRWDSITGTWRVTLYEPKRTASAPQWTFGPSDYFGMTALGVARYHIRNAVIVKYTDAASGERAEYVATDPDSILKYGRRWMEIEEADDSPINSAALAAGMADPALLDLSEPDATQEIRAPLFPPIQLGDYYRFLPNDVHYDVAQDFGVVGYTHTLDGGTGETRIRTRGKPVGSVRGWLRRENRVRPPAQAARALEILNFREIARTEAVVTYEWTLGTDLAASWIYDYREQQPYSDDKWPKPDRLPDLISDDRTVQYQVPVPEQGKVGYFQVEGRLADGALGDMERVLIFPTNTPGDYIAFATATVNQSDGSVRIAGWTTDRARSVSFAYNVGGPTVAPPSESQAENQGAGATGGGLVIGFTSDFEIVLPAGTLAYGQTIKGLLIAYINEDGTGPDGSTTNHDTPVGFAGERIKITASAQLGDGVAISRVLSESSRGYNTEILFSAVDWDRVQWSAGALNLADGSSYAINAGNTGFLPTDAVNWVYFDPAVSPNTLQVTSNYAQATGERRVILGIVRRALAGGSSGQLAFFTSPVGLLGINETIIGPNSISTPKVQALAITAGLIAAAAVTAFNINVVTLSSIQANLGTVTIGTITGSVVISGSVTIQSTLFTAATAIFKGGLEVWGGSTGKRAELKTITLLDDGYLALYSNDGESGSIVMQSGTTGTFSIEAARRVRITSIYNGVIIGQAGGNISFYDANPVARPTITGSRGGNAALASLLTALDTMGLVTNSTT